MICSTSQWTYVCSPWTEAVCLHSRCRHGCTRPRASEGPQAASSSSPSAFGCRTRPEPPPFPAGGCPPERLSPALPVWGISKNGSPRLPSRSPRWRCASFVSCLELLFCRCWWDFPWSSRPPPATCSAAAWVCTCFWSSAGEPRTCKWWSARKHFRKEFPALARRRLE